MSRQICLYVAFAVVALLFIHGELVWAQLFSSVEDLVTYEKQSGFIKEFAIPFEERGLGGITTDSKGTIWFYHSTNMTSTLVSFNPNNNEFTKYPVESQTVADTPIINLASPQLAFDEVRNVVWFTDARTNSIGKLDVPNGQIELFQIPIRNAGPMGITLSPEGMDVWFAQIGGDKIAKLDAESGEMTEYSTGEGSGPVLLTFDDKGQLWVSLAFSNSILLAQPWAIVPGSSLGMTKFSLPESDRFSPFGIAVTEGKIFLSDHGSSRLIVADENSGLRQYDLYWTSPSPVLPTTLPSQVVTDSVGNIYFAQHGGNRISVIDRTGIMTEYEIPTGPLATTVFVAASDDGKVWFTEWSANKIAYLDTMIGVPFALNVDKTAVTLDKSGPQRMVVSLDSSDAVASPVSLSEVEVGLIGMTETGMSGVTYKAQPPRVNLQQLGSVEVEVQITAQDNALPGNYVAMVIALAQEKDGLIVSKLHPVDLVLDVPEPAAGQDSSILSRQESTDNILRDALRIAAPLGVAGTLAFAIYRWRKGKRSQRL